MVCVTKNTTYLGEKKTFLSIVVHMFISQKPSSSREKKILIDSNHFHIESRTGVEKELIILLHKNVFPINHNL